jgi:hypothetical protein
MADWSWRRLAAQLAILAGALLFGPAAIAQDARATFNAWKVIDPKFSSENREYRRKDVLLDARLVPVESAELTSDALVGGQILLPRGTQLFRTWAAEKKIYCTTDSRKDWEGVLRRPVPVRLCLMEGDAAGILTSFYDNRDVRFGLPLVRKPFSDKPAPLSGVSYRIIDPREFKAQYSLQIRYDWDSNNANKSSIMAFVGPPPPKNALAGTISLRNSVSGRQFEVGGAIVHIQHYADERAIARVERVTQDPIVIHTPWLLF